MDTEETICWFAARVHSGQEVKIKNHLASLGVECFIPTEIRKNYRGQKKEHPIISALVFIHTDKQRACDLKVLEHLPVNYLFDAANHTMMVIPDKQMNDFIQVFNISVDDGGLMDCSIALGDRVRVSKGPLMGVEGDVLELRGETYVVVNLLGRFFAKAQVPRAWLEMV